MKNVIVYNQLKTQHHGGNRWTDPELFKYLHAQIDNSLRLGWALDDIILGTNFEFEYRGVKAHLLENICTWSGFHNFWYGALELVEKGILTENFWLHDHDSWQVSPMEFPDFHGLVAGVEYGCTKEWNCGSIYFNAECQDILETIVDALKRSKDSGFSSDEVVISLLRQHPVIGLHMNSINSKWNMGLTCSQNRIENSSGAPIVLSFKPDQVGIYDTLKEKNLYNLITPELQHILDKHFNGE